MTEAERTNAAVLLNQIASNLNISKELRIEAAKAFSKIKRTAGQQLSVARSFGLAPLDELNAIAEQQLSLSDDEIKSLANLADIQKKAIETGDYAASDKAMDDALAILAKHSNELDSSINPWKKGLTLDEKSCKMAQSYAKNYFLEIFCNAVCSSDILLEKRCRQCFNYSNG